MFKPFPDVKSCDDQLEIVAPYAGDPEALLLLEMLH